MKRQQAAYLVASTRWGQAGVIDGRSTKPRPKPCLQCGARYLHRKFCTVRHV